MSTHGWKGCREPQRTAKNRKEQPHPASGTDAAAESNLFEGIDARRPTFSISQMLFLCVSLFHLVLCVEIVIP
jgi:hypothetical protein